MHYVDFSLYIHSRLVLSSGGFFHSYEKFLLVFLYEKFSFLMLDVFLFMFMCAYKNII